MCVKPSWTANDPLANLKLESARNKARISVYVDIRVDRLLIREGVPRVSSRIDWSGREDLNLRPPGPELKDRTNKE